MTAVNQHNTPITQSALEQRIAELENGVGAVLSASGEHALAQVLQTLTSVGDNIICAGRPGPVACRVFRLLDELGVDVHICPQQNEAEIHRALNEQSKAIYCETLTAPSVEGAKLELLSALCRRMAIPLVVDNANATMALTECVGHGADVVVYSHLAYLCQGAAINAGAIIDSGRYDWAGAGLKVAKLNRPSPTGNHQIYTDKYGDQALLARCRLLMQQDSELSQTTLDALDQGLQTLPQRMSLYCANSRRLLALLGAHPSVSYINQGLQLDLITGRQAPFLSLGVNVQPEPLKQMMAQLGSRNLTGPIGGANYSIKLPAQGDYLDCNETERLTAMAADNVLCIYAGSGSPEIFYQTFSAALI